MAAIALAALTKAGGIASAAAGAVGGAVSGIASGVSGLIGAGGAAGGAGAVEAGITGAAGASGAPAASTFLGLTGTQLTGVSMLSSLGAGGVGIASSLAQSEAIADQQRANAAIQAEQVDMSRRRSLGSLRAGIGASGASLSGSPLSVLGEQSGVAEYDRLLTLSGGRAAARQSISRGRNQAINSGLSGFSGALKGATTLTKSNNFRSRF